MKEQHVNTALSAKKGLWMKTLQLASVLFVALLSQNSHAQTILNFDSFLDGTTVTDQYQSQGVMISGVTAINAANSFLVAHSGANVAFSVDGLMIFNFSVANVNTVSAYVTGPAATGIFAYDSSGTPVGQALLPDGAPANTLLSVTSSSNPIARVEIHDGGATFAVDDFSFTTADPVLTCRDIAKELYDAIVALPGSAFKCIPPMVFIDRARLLKEVNNFEKLRAAKASQKKLLDALNVLKKDITKTIKPAPAASLLDKVNQLITKTKANACY